MWMGILTTYGGPSLLQTAEDGKTWSYASTGIINPIWNMMFSEKVGQFILTTNTQIIGGYDGVSWSTIYPMSIQFFQFIEEEDSFVGINSSSFYASMDLQN